MSNNKKKNTFLIKKVVVNVLTIVGFVLIFFSCSKKENQENTKFNISEILKEVSFEEVKDNKKILKITSSLGDKELSINDIEKIGMKRIGTPTFWSEDDGVYEGVLISDFLKHFELEKRDSIIVYALDDYSASIKREVWEKWPIILATRRDGKLLKIKDKGPTRIIFPNVIGGIITESYWRVKWVWNIKNIRVEGKNNE